MRYDKKSGEKSLVLSDELTLSDAIEAAYLKKNVFVFVINNINY